MAQPENMREKLRLLVVRLIALSSENRAKLLDAIDRGLFSDGEMSTMYEKFTPFEEQQAAVLEKLFAENPALARDGAMLLQEVASRTETDSAFAAEMNKLTKINNLITS